MARAIHEDSGTLCVYISERASPEQREAISQIAYGRAKGTGLSTPDRKYISAPK